MNKDGRARIIYAEELRDFFDEVVKKYDASPSEVLAALKQVVEDESGFQQDLEE
jgi:hypothetical protein